MANSGLLPGCFGDYEIEEDQYYHFSRYLNICFLPIVAWVCAVVETFVTFVNLLTAIFYEMLMMIFSYLKMKIYAYDVVAKTTCEIDNLHLGWNYPVDLDYCFQALVVL